MFERENVYKAIDSERDYQDVLERHDEKQQSLMEHLSVIETICRRMHDTFYDVSGQPPVDFMRKIAATAVKCMEQHGAPMRPKVNG